MSNARIWATTTADNALKSPIGLADKRNETQEKLFSRFHSKLPLLPSLSNSGAGARAGAVMNQALDRGPQQQLSLACGKHRRDIVEMTTRTPLVKFKQICVNAKS